MTLEDYFRARIDAGVYTSSYMDFAVVRSNQHGDLLLWIGNREGETGNRTQREGFFLVRGDQVTAIETIEPGCLEEAHRRILTGQ